MNSDEENIFRGKQGTIFKVKENSFVNSNGRSFKEKWDIKLTEALDLNKFLKEGLSTMSDGKLLIREVCTN